MRIFLASSLSLLLGLAACGGRGPAGSPSGVDAGSTDVGGERADVSDALGVEPGDSDGRDLGADAMDATDAYTGVCPPPTGTALPQTNLCQTCPGVSCAPADSCASTYHDTGWFTDVCSCIDGHMGCCEWSDIYGVTFCDFGGFAQPTCAMVRPGKGDPCGPDVNGCRFTDPCCVGGSTVSGGSALCSNGTWSVVCNPPSSGTDCSTVASGTRCDVPSASDGAGSACRCDDQDAGGRAWTCGPGL